MYLGSGNKVEDVAELTLTRTIEVKDSFDSMNHV